MLQYVIRRLLLLPITLFFIVLVNFVILNLAPGDPTTVRQMSQDGTPTRREDQSGTISADDRYLQFREFYGLTLPILFNTWPWIKQPELQKALWILVHKKESPEAIEEMPVKAYDELRVGWGDRARFIMPLLLNAMQNPESDAETQRIATRLFIRGAFRQAYLGPDLSEEEKTYNRKIAKENDFLIGQVITASDDAQVRKTKVDALAAWYQANREYYNFEPSETEKIGMLFFENRFFKYISRVVTLDFGTLRNDTNKTVISEVTKRFKYSLTLSLTPMFITFFLSLIFGFIMALQQNRWPDISLNVLFLILYAIPVFVVAPFLIEKVAINGTFPFTNTPIPISGFTSPERIYAAETTSQRFWDVLQHIALPLVAIMYGTLASESRLSRTAILEVLRQDYVRTARAKGAPPLSIFTKHVGRNAAITIVTSLAGSLGIVLGGSLIVETLFQIDGFGKFFYDAILNRDYNVIMFSALAGSFLSLAGYLAADLAYAWLDPRVTLD